MGRSKKGEKERGEKSKRKNLIGQLRPTENTPSGKGRIVRPESTSGPASHWSREKPYTVPFRENGRRRGPGLANWSGCHFGSGSLIRFISRDVGTPGKLHRQVFRSSSRLQYGRRSTVKIPVLQQGSGMLEPSVPLT